MGDLDILVICDDLVSKAKLEGSEFFHGDSWTFMWRMSAGGASLAPMLCGGASWSCSWFILILIKLIFDVVLGVFGRVGTAKHDATHFDAQSVKKSAKTQCKTTFTFA